MLGLSPPSIFCKANPNLFFFFSHRLFSHNHSWLSLPGNLLMKWSSHTPKSPKCLPSLTNQNQDQQQEDSISPHKDSTSQDSITLESQIETLAKARRFDSAWSLLLDRIDGPSGDHPVAATADRSFDVLIRRYARAGMPGSAIRTFEYAETVRSVPVDSNSLYILLDALCKERHVRIASDYLFRRRQLDPGWVPCIQSYNILLNGWFRLRKLRKAERLWNDLKKENAVTPSVVTYGTLIEGYCRMGRVERAIELVSEMERVGIEPNVIVYNPIVDALGESGRFSEALGMVEKVLEFGLTPTISTYNSLVKGFCKKGDLVGASKILKMMISRQCLPTPTTYNYFFRYFSKFGMIEEGMNLYTKMIESGYNPDRLTYQLLIKMLCEQERLVLAVGIIKEMKYRGFDSDLATSTMLVHLLIRLRRLEDACFEFDDMIKRGIVPQYLTYKKLRNELNKLQMIEMSRKISDLMKTVPHSMKLPDTYRDGEDGFRELKRLRSSIMRKAQVMSDILKTSRDPRELSKIRNSSENAVMSANRLIEDIKRKVYGT